MFEIRTLHERGNASPAMNMTLSGSKTKPRRVPAKAVGSIRDSEFDSNEIDKSDLQFEENDEQRSAILKGIVTLQSQPKYRISLECAKSRMNK
jgi:hypothetical protein